MQKGEWKRAILEFDFVMETMFLQDKDRIIVVSIVDLLIVSSNASICILYIVPSLDLVMTVPTCLM